MAQISYGTITITDTNDIEEIYTIYAGSSGDTQQDMPTWTYAAVTGGTIWKRDVSLVTGDYIWQSIVITKSGVVINATNWENFYNTPICITGPEGQGGQPGTPGKGISNIAIQYCNYGSGEPANTGSHWQDTIPTYDSSKPNYWTKTTITYTVGDPFIKKVLDQGITDAMYNSAMANSISQSANENANGALSIATGVEQHFFWIGEDYSTSVPAGAYMAERGKDEFKANPTGGNLITRTDGIYIRNGANLLSSLTGSALNFYQPPTTNGNTVTQGALTMELSNGELNFYNTNGVVTSSFGNSISLASNGAAITIGSTSSYNTYINSQGLSLRNGVTENAKLDSNGLVLSKGGIIAGTTGSDSSIYISSENLGSSVESLVPTPSGGSPKTNWREIIGTKFGVDSEGNLYARDAHISGEIVITSGETANKLAAVDSDVQAINSQVKINNNQILIGNENSFHILINGDNTNPNYGLGFFLANDKVAYMNDNRLSIPYSVVLKGMEIGEEWVWELNQSTKNLTLKWKGRSTQEIE